MPLSIRWRVDLFDRQRHRERKEEEIRKTEEFNRRRKEVHFEKGDTWALIVAALTTILPVAIITILVIYFVSTWMFR